MKELKYRQIIRAVQDQIAEGFWKPGDKIYSERQLSEIHDVSRLTVKRALSELVSEGTLEYKPGRQGTFVSQTRGSAQASGREEGGKFIGVAVDNHTPAFASHILQGIHEGLWQYGYHTLYCNTYLQNEHILDQIRSLINAPIKGFILTPVLGRGAEEANRSIVELLDKRSIPFVLIDRYLEYRTDHQVTLDNREIFQALAGLLIAEGHKRILLVNGYDATSSRDRVKAVFDSYAVRPDLLAHEIVLDEKEFHLSGKIPEAALREVAAKGPFSAMIGLNQLLLEAGNQMMQALEQKPVTATIVTSPRERYCDISIVQPIGRMGKEAALLLGRVLEDPSLPVTQLSLRAAIQDNRDR